MLPKKNRLTVVEIEHVQRYGKVIRLPHFLIRYCNFTAVNGSKIETKPVVKIGVVVSKKTEKTSVGRHALKRSVYRAVENELLHTVTVPLHVAITLTASRADLEKNEDVGAVYQNMLATLKRTVFEV